jgi:hypothetical protein
LTRIFTGKRWGPWVVVASLAILLALFAGSRLGRDEIRSRIEGQAEVRDLAASTDTAISVVEDYSQYVDGLESPIEDSTVALGDVAEGLRRLAGALAVLGLGNGDLPIDLRVTAEHVLLNSNSAVAAPTLRAVLIETADAIGAERRDSAPSLRRSAAAVNPNQPIAGQVTTVQQFLRLSADALEAIALQTS